MTYNNIYSCFNNKYSQKNKYKKCHNCNNNTLSEIHSIAFLPNTITVILPLSLEKSNFMIEDELDLKPYTKYYPDKSEGICILISISTLVSIKSTILDKVIISMLLTTDIFIICFFPTK